MSVSTVKINYTFYHELHFLTSWHISFLLTLYILFIQIGRGVLSDFRKLAPPWACLVTDKMMTDTSSC